MQLRHILGMELPSVDGFNQVIWSLIPFSVRMGCVIVCFLTHQECETQPWKFSRSPFFIMTRTDIHYFIRLRYRINTAYIRYAFSGIWGGATADRIWGGLVGNAPSVAGHFYGKAHITRASPWICNNIAFGLIILWILNILHTGQSVKGKLIAWILHLCIIQLTTNIYTVWLSFNDGLQKNIISVTAHKFRHPSLIQMSCFILSVRLWDLSRHG